MGRTTDLRRSIKRSFVPYIEDKGFRIDLRKMPQFLDFRRITSEGTYVCDIQWEKSGLPRFVLNFGSCGPNGVMFCGKEVGPADITSSLTPARGRLMPGLPQFISGWFRQDRGLIQRLWKGSRLRSPDEVVGDLITLFPEVEAYWESGVIGRHISILVSGPSVNKID